MDGIHSLPPGLRGTHASLVCRSLVTECTRTSCSAEAGIFTLSSIVISKYAFYPKAKFLIPTDSQADQPSYSQRAAALPTTSIPRLYNIVLQQCIPTVPTPLCSGSPDSIQTRLFHQALRSLGLFFPYRSSNAAKLISILIKVVMVCVVRSSTKRHHRDFGLQHVMEGTSWPWPG